MNANTTVKELTQEKLVATLGGWVSIIFLLYSIATMLIVAFVGGPPGSIEECFAILKDDRFKGMLRLDILTVFVMPLYYILFYSLYKVMKPIDNGLITISVILVFAGVTMFLAAPSTFSYLHLANDYEGALTEIDKNKFISAGQAVIVTDIWHGAGPQLGGILIQSGALIISIFMLRGSVFSKLTAYIGIIMHGFDLAHILIGFFSVSAGNMLMIIAGPLYPIWFLLIGIRLIKFYRKS